MLQTWRGIYDRKLKELCRGLKHDLLLLTLSFKNIIFIFIKVNDCYSIWYAIICLTEWINIALALATHKWASRVAPHILCLNHSTHYSQWNTCSELYLPCLLLMSFKQFLIQCFWWLFFAFNFHSLSPG